MSRVLIVSHDVVGPNMAGPGIRYWEMSAALVRQGFDVTLAAPVGSSSIDEPEQSRSDLSIDENRRGKRTDPAEIRLLKYRPGDQAVVDAAQVADCVVVTGPILQQFPALVHSDRPIAVDLYDPFLFENLHHLRDTPRAWPEYIGGRSILATQMARGDFFFCANQRQRDLYQGMLTAWGRINPATYESDPTLDELLAIVPFGISSHQPRPGPAARGQIAGIDESSQLVVWNGGIWDWFDPITAIEAIALVRERLPSIRLLFLGTRHPNPVIGEPPTAIAARARAQELGLLDSFVFFRDWTPYHERGAFLLEANLAISLHVPGIETRFSSRTRLLDCIWAGVQFITSDGDAIGEELARLGLAKITPCGDIESVAQAIEALVNDVGGQSDRSVGFATLAASLSWDKVVAPLVSFARNPRRAADHRSPFSGSTSLQQSTVTGLPAGRRTIWHRILRYLAERELAESTGGPQ